jgi:hypothetical protein
MKIIVSLLVALSIVTGIATSANAFDAHSDDAQFECQTNAAPQVPGFTPGILRSMRGPCSLRNSQPADAHAGL